MTVVLRRLAGNSSIRKSCVVHPSTLYYCYLQCTRSPFPSSSSSCSFSSSSSSSSFLFLFLLPTPTLKSLFFLLLSLCFFLLLIEARGRPKPDDDDSYGLFSLPFFLSFPPPDLPPPRAGFYYPSLPPLLPPTFLV